MLRAALESLSAQPVAVAAAPRVALSSLRRQRSCSSLALTACPVSATHYPLCARRSRMQSARMVHELFSPLSRRSFVSSSSPEDFPSPSKQQGSDLLTDAEDGPLLDPNHLQQIIEASTSLNTAQDLRDHIESVTALLGHFKPAATKTMPPPPDWDDASSSTKVTQKRRAFNLERRPNGTEHTGIREHQRESLSLVLFQTALQALQRLIDLREEGAFYYSQVAALMVAATQAIRSREELFESTLDFVRVIQPQIQALDSAQSQGPSDSHRERVLATRILPAVIVAFGKAGYPHLGEQLIHQSTVNMLHSPSMEDCMRTISTATRTDGRRRIVAGQDEGAPNPDPRSAALAALRSAESSRKEHAAVSASKPWTSKRHTTADVKIDHRRVYASAAAASIIRSSPLPDLVNFRLGYWSGKPNVWTSLIQSRLAANDEVGAEVWLHIYRAFMHHRQALNIKEGGEGLTPEEYNRKWTLPPPSPKPYQARIQARIPAQFRVFKSRRQHRALEWSLRNDPAKLTASSDVAAPILSPDQTWLNQRILGFMNRDKVVADAVMMNALISFEVSCARFKNAADLMERHIRQSVRDVIWRNRKALRTHNPSEEDAPKEDAPTGEAVLSGLGPGLLAAVSEMYMQRSKFLASQVRIPADLFGEDETQMEKRAEEIRKQKEALMLPLIDVENHPFTHYLCGTSPGDILPLHLQIYHEEAYGADGPGPRRNGEEQRLGKQMETGCDEEEEARRGESQDEAGQEEPNDSGKASSGTRVRGPPRLSGFWLRQYVRSLISAPDYEFPPALILMEDLQARQAHLSQEGFAESTRLRAALQQAVGPAFVSEVLTDLARVDHTHVMRHFRAEEEENSVSGSGTRSPKVTFTKEEREDETVSIITLDHGSKQNSDAEASRIRANSSVQAALHSAEHTSLIIKMLSSAILAEVKFTTASYLDVLSGAAATVSPDGNGDVDEATIVDSDKFKAALEEIVARIREEEGEFSEVKGIDDLVPVRSAWARDLLFNRQVGGKIRLLAAKMLMTEGAIENEWETRQATARASGETLRPELDIPWAHEIREELLGIIMGEMRRQFDERGAKVRQPWPSHLLDLLATETPTVEP